ncbi:MAG: sensor domain-containing diguanylate cyclase [Candidatus Omnitrophota bacterium]
MENDIENKQEGNSLKAELARKKAELDIFYEISNAMRTTLKLDEILYCILTGVTAHVGLGFNRALLFLINEVNETIEGKMAIGPETGEEASIVWKNIEQAKMNLEDLISAYKVSGKMIDSKLNKTISELKIPLKEEGGIIAITAIDGMALHIREDTIKNSQNDIIIKLLKPREFVSVPLKSKTKTLGVIYADNMFTGKPITNEDIRILMMFANQAGLAIENSFLYEQTVNMAQTDSLTKLYNHGYFQDCLAKELENAKLISRPLSLLLIDIDNFKNYNDTLGHQSGDKILKQLGAILQESSRKLDYACRYGGEEFAIILPHTDKNEAFSISERLRNRIYEHVFWKKEIQPLQHLTVSIGLSTFPQDATDKQLLLQASDKALYQAKQSGKNKTCLYSR